eukprot:354599-Chlamydomonas_euryale.AAC.1
MGCLKRAGVHVSWTNGVFETRWRACPIRPFLSSPAHPLAWPAHPLAWPAHHLSFPAHPLAHYIPVPAVVELRQEHPFTHDLQIHTDSQSAAHTSPCSPLQAHMSNSNPPLLCCPHFSLLPLASTHVQLNPPFALLPTPLPAPPCKHTCPTQPPLCSAAHTSPCPPPLHPGFTGHPAAAHLVVQPRQLPRRGGCARGGLPAGFDRHVAGGHPTDHRPHPHQQQHRAQAHPPAAHQDRAASPAGGGSAGRMRRRAA